LGIPLPKTGEFEQVIMIAVGDRRVGWGRTEFLTRTIQKRAQVGNAQAIYQSEMALFHECIQKCARKLLDTVDIVIALGKVWKRRNRDETVKLLIGIQRV